MPLASVGDSLSRSKLRQTATLPWFGQVFGVSDFPARTGATACLSRSSVHLMPGCLAIGSDEEVDGCCDEQAPRLAHIATRSDHRSRRVRALRIGPTFTQNVYRTPHCACVPSRAPLRTRKLVELILGLMLYGV